MTVVIDSIAPLHVVIPRNGSVSVVVTGHSTPGDDSGAIDIVFTSPDSAEPVVLASVPTTVDDPNDPVPWAGIDLVPIALDGVVVANNADGSYLVMHSAA